LLNGASLMPPLAPQGVRCHDAADTCQRPSRVLCTQRQTVGRMVPIDACRVQAGGCKPLPILICKDRFRTGFTTHRRRLKCKAPIPVSGTVTLLMMHNHRHLLHEHRHVTALRGDSEGGHKKQCKALQAETLTLCAARTSNKTTKHQTTTNPHPAPQPRRCTLVELPAFSPSHRQFFFWAWYCRSGHLQTWCLRGATARPVIGYNSIVLEA